MDKTTDDTKSRGEELLEKFPELAEPLSAAIKQHGDEDIAVVELTKPKGQLCIFRAPHRAEYQKFTAQILSDNNDTKAKAAEILARSCVVYPAKEVFAGYCDRYGGIGTACLKTLSTLAGAELTDRGKE